MKNHWICSTAYIENWSIYNKGTKHIVIHNRNNNGLEWCNYHLNKKFLTLHPSLLVFVDTPEDQSCVQVKCLEIFNIEKKITNDLQEVSVGPIPEIYKTIIMWSFCECVCFQCEDPVYVCTTNSIQKGDLLVKCIIVQFSRNYIYVSMLYENLIYEKEFRTKYYLSYIFVFSNLLFVNFWVFCTSTVWIWNYNCISKVKPLTND